MISPRTHRLGDLLDLAGDRGLAVPEEFDGLHWLTPFAVEYRDEFFAEELAKPLDRAAVLAQVRWLSSTSRISLSSSLETKGPCRVWPRSTVCSVAIYPCFLICRLWRSVGLVRDCDP